MNNKQIKRFRPRNDRCIGVCSSTFMLSFSSFWMALEVEDGRMILYSIGTVLLILNIILCIFSIFKWNAFVYIDEGKITQKQFKKVVSISYDEIDRFKISRSYYIRSFPMLNIYKGEEKISLEMGHKAFNHFTEVCSNGQLINKIKKSDDIMWGK